ncbi:uncharacterized protein LOC124685387 [Lolium rigidum]|uniref:uncharacterized protein LOC124685387 n=1 Tax=Lolium rigidum TaxID=89674 RepID=UPI001F5CFE98|nr:uncharacterized protein LOC124685387 [Lolium rigidum]
MAASASAPGAEPQKQLLSIIRDFAAEKSHGERTVSGLKRRLDDVLAAADAATAELDAAKRAREAAETDLRGTQVQASIAAATIQALEATISHLQEEIAKLGSELEELKSKEDSERDEFISQMVEMNARIRQFQQMASVELARKCSEVSTDGEQGKAADGNQGKGTDGHNVSDKNETAESEDMVTDLADKLSNIEAEMHALEEEYQKDLLDHKQVCQELADVQAKRALIEAVMDETKQLQEVGGRVAEMEKVLNSVAEELQRRYMCRGCGTNNMGGMGEAARTSSN